MLLSNPLLLLKWVFVVLKAFSLIFPVAPLPPAAPSWFAGSLCSSGTGAVWALMGNIWYWDQQAETVEALLSKIQTTSVNLFFFSLIIVSIFFSKIALRHPHLTGCKASAPLFGKVSECALLHMLPWRRSSLPP